jgi:hypothetical protein
MIAIPRTIIEERSGDHQEFLMEKHALLHPAAIRASAGPTDLNAEMVRSGWAVTDGGRDHRRAEDEARVARRGMWQGRFRRPAEWRKANGGS